jgi:hypothetical protein
MQRTPPPKRRKTSPTTSFPVDAPTSLGRIPPSQQDAARSPTRRPSFASPTKASLARHNPQLLNRPTSSGAGSEKPGNKGKLGDLFAKALGETNSGIEAEIPGIGESPRRPRSTVGKLAPGFQESSRRPPSQGSRALGGDNRTPEAPKRFTPNAKTQNAPSGGISAKPRSMSQSPIKSPIKQPSSAAPKEVEILGENLPDNPFQKKSGLRRSPISSQAPIDVNSSQKENLAEDRNPFRKKTGLRRSPIGSQTLAVEEQPIEQDEAPKPVTPARKSALRRSPVMAEPLTTLAEPIGQIGTHAGMSPVRKGALRRSPILGLAQTIVPPEIFPVAEPRLEIPIRREPSPRLSPALDPIRSSPPSSPSIPQHGNHPGISPVRKGALRRSPVVNVLQRVEPEHPTTGLDETPNQPPKPVPVRRRSPRLEENVGATPERPETPIVSYKKSSTPPIQAENNTPSIEPTEVEEPAHITVSTNPRESPPAFTAEDRDSSINQQEDSEASIMKESAMLPASRSSVLKNAQRQQDHFLPLTFPKKALVEKPALLRHASPRRRGRHPEPELPPTPIQRGIPDPVATTPPAGIHSSPSKRPRRSRVLGEKLKSSPLKPRNPPPQEPSQDQSQERIPDSYPESIPSSAGKGKATEVPTRRKSARVMVTPDPHAEKKAARDALLKELQQLQADVALANQENERLRQNHESRKRRAQPAPNVDEVVALLQRATSAPSKPEAKAPSIFKAISSFLPFSSRRRRPVVTATDFSKPVPSHRPLEVDDPLPYLKAFSTLTYKSTITLHPPDQTSPDSSGQNIERPILQNHLINASHPSGLFSARIFMTVDTSTLKVEEISIPTFDPFAEKELGTFVRNRASGKDPIGKDINVICWAMSRWSEVAIKRAKFWHVIQNQLQTSEARQRSLKKVTKKPKRKIVDEDEDEEERIKPTRKELLYHMGRTSMEIVNEEVELLINWTIGFDWTGEVENCISADVRVPGTCKSFAFFLW